MDGLELTLIDKTGMLIGEPSHLAPLLSVLEADAAYASGSWLTSLTYGILLLQIVLYIRSKAADP